MMEDSDMQSNTHDNQETGSNQEGQPAQGEQPGGGAKPTQDPAPQAPHGEQAGSMPSMPYQPLVVRGDSLAQAWESAVRTMMSKGYNRYVRAPEYQTWTKDSPMFIMVDDPMREPRLSSKAMITRQMCDEYAHSLIHGHTDDKENSFEYTYYSRLRHYPDCMIRAGLPHISEDEASTKDYVHKVSGGKCVVERLDQVAKAIEIFKKDPTRRTVVLHTWIPFRDLAKFTPERVDTSSPCLVVLHPQVVEDRLHFNVVMKTNDLFNAWPGNAYAFTELQKYMAEQIGVGVGHYTHFSVSMQVYQEVFGAAKEI